MNGVAISACPAVTIGVAVFSVCSLKVGLPSASSPRRKTPIDGARSSVTQVTSGGAVMRKTVRVIIAADSSKPERRSYRELLWKRMADVYSSKHKTASWSLLRI